jgi:MFS family permease
VRRVWHSRPWPHPPSPAQAPAPGPAQAPAAQVAADQRPHANGWAVVTGAFLVTMVGFGAVYSYAAFAEDIARTFGSSRVSVSIVYALSGGSCFFISAVSGALADRLGTRLMATMGMLLVGLGIAATAAARSLIEVYAAYGLLVGLGCGFAYVPALVAVQQSFDAQRGFASGIALSGIGVGTALIPPAAEAFAALGDWRTTFVLCGGLAAVTGLCGAVLLPGLAPDAKAAGRNAPSCDPPPAALRDGFAITYAGTLLVSVTVALPHAMLVDTARDLGIDRQDALALLGLIGIGTIVGRFILSAIADVVGRRAIFLVCCSATSVSMAFWAMAKHQPALQAFALGFGALQGGFVALLPAFIADSFGARKLGTVLGILYTSRGVALLAAPPALAAGITLSAGHQWPLMAAAALGMAGTILLARVRRIRG